MKTTTITLNAVFILRATLNGILALGLGLLLIGKSANAQSNCGNGTPVSNDSCYRMQQNALQQCKFINSGTPGETYMGTNNVHLRCLQYGGNGACIQAEYSCNNVYQNSRGERRVHQLRGGGIRG